MKLKINRYTFDVSDKDWILDNGSCYQCMTLRHKSSERWSKELATLMAKQQFIKLVQDGLLVEYKGDIPAIYKGCKIWRFNVEHTIKKRLIKNNLINY